MAKTKRPPQTRKKLGGARVAPDGPRQDKVDAVEDFKARVSGSSAVILTEYRGMTVQELAELRTSLREAGTDYKVFKNTLATIAARDLGLEDLVAHLEGPTAVAFANGDPVVTAKRLSDFAKRVPTLVLKGGVLEGKILTAKDVTALSTLESREVLLAKAAGLFLSQIQKAANLFAAPLNQLGSLLAQLKDKLPAEGAAPAAPAAAADAAPAEAAPTADEPAASADEPSVAAGDAGSEAEAQPAADEAPAEAPDGDTPATTDETTEA